MLDEACLAVDVEEWGLPNERAARQVRPLDEEGG